MHLELLEFLPPCGFHIAIACKDLFSVIRHVIVQVDRKGQPLWRKRDL